MRILVVEDSVRLQIYIGKALTKAGYAVDTADDGERGLWMAQSVDYDVIILDLMLPKLDGLSLLAQLRKNQKNTHVIILTAKDTVEDRVKGLQEGADDYLIKPFAMEELLARVGALVRRKHGVKSSRLEFGSLTIDTASRTVFRNDEEIELSPREYVLLEYLAMREGVVVSRAEIEEHIYDDHVSPMSNVVNSAVCILRRKIDSGEPPLIRTRRGMGYILQRPAKES